MKEKNCGTWTSYLFFCTFFFLCKKTLPRDCLQRFWNLKSGFTPSNSELFSFRVLVKSTRLAGLAVLQRDTGRNFAFSISSVSNSPRNTVGLKTKFAHCLRGFLSLPKSTFSHRWCGSETGNLRQRQVMKIFWWLKSFSLFSPSSD